jgi:peptidoglycan/LPS O-acetylase OafA/YrhL
MPAPNRPVPEKRTPLPALTGIRIFAAYYVVMLHTGSGYFGRHGAPQVILRLLDKGYMAVSLFFVLSGFILAYTYEGKLRDPRGALGFWEARFARIYPVYVLSLALMVPFARDVTLGQKFTVLSMVQTWMPWRPDLIGAWNFPAWSLSVEAFFYSAFPPIFLSLCRMRVAGLRRLACLLMALIAVGNLAQPIERWSLSSWLFVRYIPVPVLRLPEFVLGMALGLLFLRAPKLRHGGLISTGAAVAALVFLSLPVTRWTSLVIVPFALLIASLANQTGPLARLLSTRILVLLGSASYAVYLLQLPVRIYSRLLVAKLPHAPVDLDAFLSPGVLLLFSVLIFLFWEEPARKFLRKALGLRPRWKWPYLPPSDPLAKAMVNKSSKERLL